MKKCLMIIAIFVTWAILGADGFIGTQQCAFAQDGFPAKHKIAPKGFFLSTPLPSPAYPKGLFPGKWKLEITQDFVKPKEPELKKECPVPAILEKLQAPGPAIKIDIKKPECDKNGKNGNGKDKNAKNNGKNGDKKDDKNGGDDEEEDEAPDTADSGWDVGRPWISVTQG